MNYRHIYHAGNFADVIKHVIMVTAIDFLQQKSSPFLWLDTHAGIGLYPLGSTETQKKTEFHQGITQLFKQDPSQMPDMVRRYVELVNDINQHDELTHYPGSPKIAAALLRPEDQLVLCELHPEDYQTLRFNMKNHSRTAIHHQDGYLGMKAFLPPKLTRGFVMIDPPFEKPGEFTHIAQMLKTMQKSWRDGRYMIWYPIKSQAIMEDFLAQIPVPKADQLNIQFSLNALPESDTQMTSCGVLLIRPPWGIATVLKDSILPYLAEKLSGHWQMSETES